ncbi:MAG: carbon-nitrogen hydrolase family protein [Thermoleophilia bacterium]|nr:carbon-nitrogen hydrolase family protein [Thermoleophilia bacterium]
MLRIGLAQLNSRQNKAANLEAAGKAIDRLASLGADLILLPEMFNFHGLDQANAEAAEPIPGPSTLWAAEKAREHGVFLHCGSLAELRGEKVYNTSVVYDRSGREVARYSKLHLWDARTPDGLEYRESEWFSAGEQLTVFPCEGIVAGLAICYDLRFPELFRALADMGAQLFLIPAAFTVPTGISHWEPLLRARAIENGCYVAACGQWGPYARGRQNYGHSMVVDPWGMVIAQCSEGAGVVTADIDVDYVREVRERMPVLRHRRLDLFK